MRLIEDHGGVTLANKIVERLMLEDGRCAGVECSDGSSYRAAKAVLSTIHIKHLVQMAPRELWADDFVDGVDDLAGRADAVCDALRQQRADEIQWRRRHHLFGRLRDAPEPTRALAHGL